MCVFPRTLTEVDSVDSGEPLLLFCVLLRSFNHTFFVSAHEEMEVLFKDLLPIVVPASEKDSKVAPLLKGLIAAVDAKKLCGHYDIVEACKQARKLVRRYPA
jgi:hypothetical protein